jgi:REP element-mobilizing transposase RayT
VLSDIENTILERNIYGVDLNEESVEIAKLSLWLRTAQPRRKLNSLNNNIKCGNSLIDDKKVAGDKAFTWETEFPEVFKEKEKKAFHITWATHNTRVSEQMVEHNVKVGEPVLLNEEEEVHITDTIRDIVVTDKLNVLAYTIGVHHVHLLLVCEEEEIPNIVRKLKGKSSQKLKEYKGIAKEEKHTLWAQKYNTGYIDSEEQLQNTLSYIQTNRDKHDLSRNKGLQPLVREMTTDRATAYRTEYKGGFDVVIGNPPYVRVQELMHKEIDWYKKNKKVAFKRVDISLLFFELSKNILKSLGKVSYITSNQFISTEYGRKCRQFIIDNFRIDKIIDFGDLPVFEDALTYVSIFSFTNTKKSDFIYSKVSSLEEIRSFDIQTNLKIAISSLSEDSWTMVSKNEEEILSKLSTAERLGGFGNCNYGIVSGNDSIFILDNEGINRNQIEKGALLPLIRANDCGRYAEIKASLKIIYPYQFIDSKTVLIPEDELLVKYPNTYKLVQTN